MVAGGLAAGGVAAVAVSRCCRRIICVRLRSQVRAADPGTSHRVVNAKVLGRPEVAARGVMPRPLVLCGPSGSGKSTLLTRLTEEFPNAFGFSVSHTTRKPRPGEVEGIHYHFVTRPHLESAIRRGDFVESAEFSGNLYGTSLAAIEKVRAMGKICILDIEVQGVIQIKQRSLHCQFVFIRPPSLVTLEERLRERNTETEECLQRRLEAAREELAYGEQKGNFDLVIVNNNLEKSYETLREFILPDIELMKKEELLKNKTKKSKKSATQMESIL